MHKFLTFVVAFQAKAAQLADNKERGATATEYALLIALIAVVIYLGVWAFGGALSSFFVSLGQTVQGWV